nr:helix-turn-helix transcriptional regulator [uncultured Tyzzerella sp.]
MSNFSNITIGARIKEQRKKLNLTRETFSEKISISPQFLSEIENGKKGMSIETLYKICNTFNISADYLLFGNLFISNSNNNIYNLLKDNDYYDDIQNILISLDNITKKNKG